MIDFHIDQRDQGKTKRNMVGFLNNLEPISFHSLGTATAYGVSIWRGAARVGPPFFLNAFFCGRSGPRVADYDIEITASLTSPLLSHRSRHRRRVVTPSQCSGTMTENGIQVNHLDNSNSRFCCQRLLNNYSMMELILFPPPLSLFFPWPQS